MNNLASNGKIKPEWRVSADGRVAHLSGLVSFTTAQQLMLDIDKRQLNHVDTIDCSGVQEADSTALALLLTVVARVKKNNPSVKIDALNQRLASLAQVYGVDGLLNLTL